MHSSGGKGVPLSPWQYGKPYIPSTREFQEAAIQAVDRQNEGSEGPDLRCPCRNERVAAVAVSGIEHGHERLERRLCSFYPEITFFRTLMQEMSVVAACLHDVGRGKFRIINI